MDRDDHGRRATNDAGPAPGPSSPAERDAPHTHPPTEDGTKRAGQPSAAASDPGLAGADAPTRAPGRPPFSPPIDPNDPATWPESARAYLQRRERATAGNPALVELIRARIREQGPMPFADFMRLALYHPEHGYYASPGPRLGPAGDFVTAPETHPAFGALVCRRLVALWDEIGRPERFQVVEGGPGTGALAVQVLGYAADRHPRFHQALSYTLVETSPALREEQRRRLASEGGRVSWVDAIEELEPASVRGCVLSNELLDALPAHRVRMTAEGLREIHVGLEGEGFADVLLPPSTPDLEAYFAWVGVTPPVGVEAEVNLDALRWYRAAAGRLCRGSILTIDYGHPADELFTAERPRGTLLCYYRHSTNEEPYRRVGCQDITTHVDFTALQKAGEEMGLRTTAFATQREWLAGQGIDDWLKRRERWPEADQRPYRSLLSLIDPAVLGRLRVLEQERTADCGFRNAGLAPAVR